MSLKKYCKQIFIIGAVVAITGIILSNRFNETKDFIAFSFIVFGTYWTGLAVGLHYEEDKITENASNETRSRT